LDHHWIVTTVDVVGVLQTFKFDGTSAWDVNQTTVLTGADDLSMNDDMSLAVFTSSQTHNDLFIHSGTIFASSGSTLTTDSSARTARMNKKTVSSGDPIYLTLSYPSRNLFEVYRYDGSQFQSIYNHPAQASPITGFVSEEGNWLVAYMGASLFLYQNDGSDSFTLNQTVTDADG
jgi:hypothetical protein